MTSFYRYKNTFNIIKIFQDLPDKNLYRAMSICGGKFQNEVEVSDQELKTDYNYIDLQKGVWLNPKNAIRSVVTSGSITQPDSCYIRTANDSTHEDLCWLTSYVNNEAIETIMAAPTISLSVMLPLEEPKGCECGGAYTKEQTHAFWCGK